jgi:hypothetical protein
MNGSLDCGISPVHTKLKLLSGWTHHPLTRVTASRRPEHRVERLEHLFLGNQTFIYKKTA